MRLYISFVLMVACAISSATAQSVPRNRLTFSGGWSRQIANRYERQTATGFGLSYGYRVYKYAEVEAGVFTALDPTGETCGHSGCVDVGDRYFWLPFGVRFVAPLHHCGMEISGGGGGLYEKYTVARLFPGGGPLPRHGWGGYFVASAVMALDLGRHFWLGVTRLRSLASPAYAPERKQQTP